MTSPISDKDIEAELSYAYLHAVASLAGAACTVSPRQLDNIGIDARLTAVGPFVGGGERNEVDVNIQLKATIADPFDSGTHLSYFLKEVNHYDDLRAKTYSIPRILVVLYLPKSKHEWLEASEQFLSLKRCAYWVSLAGAKESSNTSGVTVYLPKHQILTPASLSSLFSDLSHGKIPEYAKPGDEV